MSCAYVHTTRGGRRCARICIREAQPRLSYCTLVIQGVCLWGVHTEDGRQDAICAPAKRASFQLFLFFAPLCRAFFFFYGFSFSLTYLELCVWRCRSWCASYFWGEMLVSHRAAFVFVKEAEIEKITIHPTGLRAT